MISVDTKQSDRQTDEVTLHSITLVCRAINDKRQSIVSNSTRRDAQCRRSTQSLGSVSGKTDPSVDVGRLTHLDGVNRWIQSNMVKKFSDFSSGTVYEEQLKEHTAPSMLSRDRSHDRFDRWDTRQCMWPVTQSYMDGLRRHGGSFRRWYRKSTSTGCRSPYCRCLYGSPSGSSAFRDRGTAETDDI